MGAGGGDWGWLLNPTNPTPGIPKTNHTTAGHEPGGCGPRAHTGLGPKCIAHIPNGDDEYLICGAPAVAIDKNVGGAVCELHVSQATTPPDVLSILRTVHNAATPPDGLHPRHDIEAIFELLQALSDADAERSNHEQVVLGLMRHEATMSVAGRSLTIEDRARREDAEALAHAACIKSVNASRALLAEYRRPFQDRPETRGSQAGRIQDGRVVLNDSQGRAIPPSVLSHRNDVVDASLAQALPAVMGGQGRGDYTPQIGRRLDKTG